MCKTHMKKTKKKLKDTKENLKIVLPRFWMGRINIFLIFLGKFSPKQVIKLIQSNAQPAKKRDKIVWNRKKPWDYGEKNLLNSSHINNYLLNSYYVLHTLENTELLKKWIKVKQGGEGGEGGKRGKRPQPWSSLSYGSLLDLCYVPSGGDCKIPNGIHLADSPFNYKIREDFRSPRRT